MSAIDRIRQMIRDRDYYLSSHAEEEMVDDGFVRSDVENAILQGCVEKKLAHDPRGTRYRVEGPAHDGRVMHVVCRFHETRGSYHYHRLRERVTPMKCEFCDGENDVTPSQEAPLAQGAGSTSSKT